LQVPPKKRVDLSQMTVDTSAAGRASGSVSGVAGAVSGAVASLLVQPLDVIKTRQQQFVTLAKDQALAKYKTTLDTMKTIIKEEKLLGLWKGTAPTLYRVIPGAGINFFFLHYITTVLQNSDKQLSKTNTLIAGALARTLATVTMLPVTVVKTRFEGFGTNQYNNTFHALKTIHATEGVRGLFSGLVPSVLRDAPFAGIYYLFYRQSQVFLTTTFTSTNGSNIVSLSVPSSLINFVSGCWAATVATLITHPQDLVKTRLQINPLQRSESSSSRAFRLCSGIYQQEGFKGFYKGLMPRLIRRPISNAITWVIYEEIVKALT